ncbi:NAD(P)H-dependent oxidoreductase [Lactobacillus murinus]|uniref:flavodoxin family protein n=1 Tax=Ligilactobacillus murinus TaxID=1622 RepID=UPI001883A7D6|nr:NAD(P)H-dependent oxidoreductase [Ligilactobacillus murinus]MBF0832605.1 NAD(P)H-dependent oxidoreductase [Ligilactobacillus murinus]
MSWLKKNGLLDGKIVFVNASEHAQGNTHRIGQRLLSGKDFSQLDLVNYKIYQIGQNYADDQFNEVLAKLKEADTIILGTPVYWSNMSGYLKTFVDHMQINNDLSGADLYLIVQGSDKDQSKAIASTYGTFDRIARRFKLNFVGIAQTDKQVT